MDTILACSEWFSIRDGGAGEYVASAGDEVMAVPLTADGQVLLSIEPSSAFGGETLILPGGQVEPDVPNAEMANRELQEEIGYAAARIENLGELRPWSKYLAVRTFVFLARDLSESRLQGDEDYKIGIERVPLDEFEPLMAEGRLLDARVIAALYMAQAFLAAEDKGVER